MPTITPSEPLDNSTDSSTPNYPLGMPGGFAEFKGIPLDKNGGGLITSGSFSSCDVYCEKQMVTLAKHDATDNYPLPGGTGKATSGYAYPEAPAHGVVVYQVAADGTVTYNSVTSTDSDNPQHFEMDDNTNLYAAVNDNIYGDNEGTFHIKVKLNTAP